VSISTYSDLQTAVAQWVNRDDDDFVAIVPTLIELCEARIRRNQRWFERTYSQVKGSALAITADPQTTDIGAKEVISVWADTDVWKHEIEVVSHATLHELQKTNRNANGIPTKVAISTPFMSFSFWPAPALDGSFKIDFKYIWDVAPLATENTNALLTRHPDLYLYGTLAESAPYLLHDDRVPLWEQRYQQAVTEINREREHALYGTMTKRINFRRSF
jgi:hypothetical protein